MNASMQRNVASSSSTIGNRTGHRLDAAMLACGAQWHAERGTRNGPSDNGFPVQGLALIVHSGPCLVIEDAVGCGACVLAGQAWITAEGAPCDTIAATGTTVALQGGVRYNVSAFDDIGAVLITAPERARAITYRLRRRGGIRVLTVAMEGDLLSFSLSEFFASAAGFARRRFAAISAATT